MQSSGMQTCRDRVVPAACEHQTQPAVLGTLFYANRRCLDLLDAPRSHHSPAHQVPTEPGCLRAGRLVVVAPRKHLLLGGVQEEGVLVLRHVGVLRITQRGVGVHDASLHEVLEGHEILRLADAVQVPPAERQRAKVPACMRPHHTLP